MVLVGCCEVFASETMSWRLAIGTRTRYRWLTATIWYSIAWTLMDITWEMSNEMYAWCGNMLNLAKSSNACRGSSSKYALGATHTCFNHCGGVDVNRVLRLGVCLFFAKRWDKRLSSGIANHLKLTGLRAGGAQGPDEELPHLSRMTSAPETRPSCRHVCSTCSSGRRH